MERRVIAEKKKMNKAKIGLYLMGFFLIALMIGSSITMRGEEFDRVEYNGVKFQEVEGGWIGYRGEERILLTNNPNELAEVSIKGEGFDQLNSLSKLYLSLNPDDRIQNALYEYEFSQNIRIEPPMFNSCFKDFEGCEDLPIKTCEDASSVTGVIIFKTGENNTINFKNNCLVVEGKEDEIVSVVDSLVLKWKRI